MGQLTNQLTHSYQLTHSNALRAETTGFEPATFGLTGQYANRYTTPPHLLKWVSLRSSSQLRSTQLIVEEYHLACVLSNVGDGFHIARHLL